MSQRMGSMHMNQKAVLGTVVIGISALYLIYSYLYEPKTGTTAVTDLTKGTWKTKKFVEIPQAIMKDSVQIEERVIDVETGGKRFKVPLKEVNSNDKEGLSVLLLHGAAYSSATWKEINTLQLIGAMGMRGMAIDLPSKKKDKMDEIDKPGFLDSVIKQERLGKPIIVSPSMSGSFSVPYMMNHNPHQCHEKAFAFISIAPVGTNLYKHAEYHRCAIPTMIVYGTKDKNLGLEATGNLRNMPNSEIVQMDKAGHACYIDKPKEWNVILYNFLIAMEKYRNYKYENY